MKISIIIPVYNISDYIKRCIVSCLNQDVDPSEYEIIIVNDGSTDSSLAIIEPFAQHHPHVRLINQKNKGLSGARNTGLVYAKGDYIWFVDGDDWIKENSLQDLLAFTTRYAFDIIAFDAMIITKANQVQTRKKTQEDVLSFRGIDFLRDNVTEGVWNMLFSKRFLTNNKLEFVEGLIHEDADFNIRALTLAQHMSYYPHPLYHYVSDRTNSIMNVMSLKRAVAPLFITRRYMQFIDEYHFNIKTSQIIAKKGCIEQNISFIYASKLNQYDQKVYYKAVKEYKKDLCKCLIKSLSLRYWIQFFGIWIFPVVSIKLIWKIRALFGKL